MRASVFLVGRVTVPLAFTAKEVDVAAPVPLFAENVTVGKSYLTTTIPEPPRPEVALVPPSNPPPPPPEPVPSTPCSAK